MQVVELSKSIQKVAEFQARGERHIVTSHEAWEQLKNQPPLETIKSKLPLLDSITGGFEPGELVVISGPRKGGKTLLAQTITERFAKQGVTTLWFSWELPKQQFLERFPELPFFTLPDSLKAYDLNWIQERIVEAIMSPDYTARAVVLDHLHYIYDIARARNTSLEIGFIIRWLKQLAVNLNQVIFLICHMQKTKFDNEPDDSNIRDSSFVSQESDTALILWRQTENETWAMLKVAYHRRTGAMNRKVPLIKVDGLLQEREEGDRWTIPE